MKINEKKVLDIISNAIENVEIEVLEKINNSSKSGLEDISTDQTDIFKTSVRSSSYKKIVSIAAIFIFLFIGTYLINNIGGKYIMKKDDLCVSATSIMLLREYNNTIYFQNFADKNKLYSMDIDGSNIQKVIDDSCSGFTISDNNIYYIKNEDGSIYSLKIGESTSNLINKTNANWNIETIDEWIYYSTDEGIFKIQKDGLDAVKIFDNLPNEMLINKNILYFSCNQENLEGIFKIEPDSQNITQIYDKQVSSFKIQNNDLILCDINDNYNLYKISLEENSNVQKITQFGLSTSAFDIYNNNIYFITENLANISILYKMDLSGNELKEISEIDSTFIKVIARNIYCYHPSYNGLLTKVGLEDKSKIQILSGE